MVANFMSIDYLPHLIARDTIFIFLGCISTYERNRHEENTIAAAGVIIVLLILGAESIIYVNHKAKANLFMRMQVISLQQEQLKNLFDTMPDKVLILSKTSEASAPKSLYSNRQMNDFFGCDVVNSEKRNRS